MSERQRTLRGVHQGQRLLIAEGEWVTVWDSVLLLARNRLPHRGVRRWRGRLVVGGRAWRAIPHAMVKNPLNLACYEDTLMSLILYPLRPWLIPGRAPEKRLWRWLKARWRR